MRKQRSQGARAHRPSAFRLNARMTIGWCPTAINSRSEARMASGLWHRLLALAREACEDAKGIHFFTREQRSQVASALQLSIFVWELISKAAGAHRLIVFVPKQGWQAAGFGAYWQSFGWLALAAKGSQRIMDHKLILHCRCQSSFGVRITSGWWPVRFILEWGLRGTGATSNCH